jgi:hypothetical protein
MFTLFIEADNQHSTRLQPHTRWRLTVFRDGRSVWGGTVYECNVWQAIQFAAGSALTFCQPVG